MLRRSPRHSSQGLDVEPWMWGVFLCVVSTCLTALGLVFQKYSHIQNECFQEGVKYYRQPVWLTGFLVFLVGQVMNVWAMALTPQVMTSCLGAWSLIFNAAFARTLLGERTRLPEIAAMVGMICGVILVIARTPMSGEAGRTGDFYTVIQALLDVEFLVLAGALVVGLSFAYVVTSKFRPNMLAVYWAVVSSAVSGYTVAVFKGVSMLLTLHSAPWGYWQFYVVLATGGVLCTWQLHVLNMALRQGSAVVVVPTSFALGMLFQILTGHFAFKELQDFSSWQEGLGFWLGVGIVLTCTAVMARSKITAEAEPEPDDSEEAAGPGVKPEATENTRLLSPQGEMTLSSLGGERAGTPPRVSSLGSLDPDSFRASFDDTERLYIVPLTPQSGVI